MRDIGLECVGSRLRWLRAPEDLEQPVRRHHFVGANDEGREQQAGLRARKFDRSAVIGDLECSEYPYLHVG